MDFCEILGVAQAYQDTLTIEVVNRELETHSLSDSPLCRSASDIAKEIGYTRLLTGEDNSPNSSDVMSLYFEYKNAILDSIRKLMN